jgi:hypothetical protein
MWFYNSIITVLAGGVHRKNKAPAGVIANRGGKGSYFFSSRSLAISFRIMSGIVLPMSSLRKYRTIKVVS